MTIVETAKNLSPEVREKALKCKTADELLALAKANNVELSQEQAAEILKLSKNGELSDADLDAVAGGGGCGVEVDPCAADICTGKITVK